MPLSVCVCLFRCRRNIRCRCCLWCGRLLWLQLKVLALLNRQIWFWQYSTGRWLFFTLLSLPEQFVVRSPSVEVVEAECKTEKIVFGIIEHLLFFCQQEGNFFSLTSALSTSDVWLCVVCSVCCWKFMTFQLLWLLFWVLSGQNRKTAIGTVTAADAVLFMFASISSTINALQEGSTSSN